MRMIALFSVLKVVRFRLTVELRMSVKVLFMSVKVFAFLEGIVKLIRRCRFVNTKLF